MKAVNLIPSEQRGGGGGSAAGASNGAAFMVLGLLVGLAVLAGLYGIASHQVSTRKSEVANITAQAQATQARAAELAPYVSFKQMYQQRLQAVSQLVGTRFDWAHAFHELGRVLPSDVSLSSVHGTVGATAPGSAAPAAATTAASASAVASATPAGSIPIFTLAGCATSQSEVAQTLQRLRLIDGVSGVTLASSTKGGGGASASGACPPHDPAFAASVTFAGLPTPPAAPTTSASTATASATGAASTPTSAAKGAQ